jgi:hypothetical protein
LDGWVGLDDVLGFLSCLLCFSLFLSPFLFCSYIFDSPLRFVTIIDSPHKHNKR